ncbi:TonB-dependent receptor [Hufsiella ginkgonis]|uniref:Outer membrane beta-barrel protein n=1 Tax=Hufsiella ginkgonis TaxID=2695274 RepID=A0A7K1XVC8_9SPHI|nr:TonB-dependent receptor [Hufsiella ginkgonis]MXV14934.1 outer membrane beta-barrel protein [Hufsiella ginkgonis]
MMKTLYLYFFLMLCSGALYAQTPRQVSGVVKDTTGQSVIGATIKLVAGTDTLRMSSKTDGTFSFNNVKRSQFVLTISNLGYNQQTRKYAYNDGAEPIVLEPIVLKEESQVLGTVNITTVRSVIIKEDTIEYRASDYKLPVNSTTEDLLKKVPGLEVDKDGAVTAQGKSVTKVRVNGKDYFGGDLQTATKNLPADLIERIQIIDDYGDQANLTGSRNGDSEKIINITIRPDKNKGFFGNAVAGAGRDVQDAGAPEAERHQLSANANYFNNTRQMNILGNINNTNANLFNFGGGGNNGGGGGNNGGGGGNNGGGGGNNGGGGGGNNGGQPRGGNSLNGRGGGNDGISSASAVGFNYRDQLGKRVTTYGSYSFSNRDNNSVSTTFREDPYPTNGNVLNNIKTDALTSTLNHRFNWNLEFAPDSMNYIKFSPSFSYSKSNGNSYTQLAQQGNSIINSSTQNTRALTSNETPNWGGNILLNHRFHKQGRNVSLFLNINGNNTNSDQETDFIGTYRDVTTNNVVKDSTLNQRLHNDNKSVSSGARFLYIEPIGKRASLEANWNYSRANYDNARETFDLNKGDVRVDSLSNIYNYSFTTNNFGLTYRFTEKKYNYSIGISGQPSLLEGESISRGVTSRRTGFNFVPIARFTYKFSRSKEFNVNYFGRNNEPSFQQIQPVADRSNPNNPIIGNPNLNAEFNHSFNIRFNNTQFTTGRTLFANFNLNMTNDKIVNNSVRVIKNKIITQETRFLNADGYYSMFGFYTYSIPMAQRKYILTFGGSLNYNNNISYADSEKNIGKNTIASQRVRLQINPSTRFELTPQVRYIYNATKNSLSDFANSNNNLQTWEMSTDGKFFFAKSMLVGIDYNKNINSGYSGSVANNPQILSTYLEKQFFEDKRATLRFQGYDLFNENTGISSTISTTGARTETRNNRLGRYFMMTFTMRLQKFASGSIAPDNMNQNNGDRRREGGFGGGNRPPGTGN